MNLDSGLVGQANRQHIDTIRWRLQQLNCKTPDEQEIRLFKDEQTKLAIIELRSGAKNALSGKMISQLTEIIDELYAWPEGRGLLVCGYGQTFCSGSDLTSVRETANQEWGLDLANVMQYNLRRIQLLPMISVALIEGYALGGGSELATATDMRLMTDSAKIGFVHIKVGVCCGWGGGSRLVQLIGPSRALELLSSGRLVGSHEALQLGLSNATISKISDDNTKFFTSTLANNAINVKPYDAQDNDNNNNEKKKQIIAKENITLTNLCNFTRSSCDLNGNNHNISIKSESTTTSDKNMKTTITKTNLTSENLELTLERCQALEFLRRHTVGNLETIKALKSMINAARFEPLHESLAKEAHLFASTWGQEAHLQALAGNIKHN